MDEQRVVDGLRSAVSEEPPLGFDPDEVATRAAKHQQHRRATLATGIATMVVVGVVSTSIALSGAGSVPEQQHVAAPPPTTSKEQKTRKPRPQIAPPNVDLSTDAANLKGLLADALRGLLPEANEIEVEPFSQKELDGRWDSLTGSAKFLDSTGRAQINLSVHGRAAALGLVEPLDEQCEDLVDPMGRPQLTNLQPLPSQEQRNNEPQRSCDKLKQRDGSTVVLDKVMDVIPAPKAPEKGKSLVFIQAHATHYRVDGTVVSVWNTNGSPMLSRERAALTEDQAIALVTDPRFALVK